MAQFVLSPGLKTKVDDIADDDDSESDVEEEEEHKDEDEQFVTFDDGMSKVIQKCIRVRQYKDGNGIVHGLAKYPVMVGANDRKRGMIKQCHSCKKHTTCFCVCCMKPYCHSLTSKHSRTCFVDHLPNRLSPRHSDA